MASKRFIGGLVLVTVALAACDGGEAETVGPQGGVVRSRDGRVTLTIPDGALQESVEVSIEEVEDGPADAVGTVYVVEPEFLQLHRPALIEYDVTAPEIAGADALDLQGMDGVSLVTEKEHGWEPLADHDADPDTGLVTASVLFFGTVALVQE